MPNPGIDEYRKYWDEHEVTRKQTNVENGDVELAGEQEITELTASFVAASCEHVPTKAEWVECLQEAGYSEDKINEIFGEDAEG